MRLMPDASILPYLGHLPQLAKSVFLATGSRVIGQVQIGEDSSVWFNVVIRGDVQTIKIGARTNIQDLTMIHVTTGTGPTVIGDDVTVGHQATLHACSIGNRVLVGMGSIILDGAVIQDDTMIGAGSLIAPGKTFPSKHLVMGSPARAVRPLTAGELEFLKTSAKQYVETASNYLRDGHRDNID